MEKVTKKTTDRPVPDFARVRQAVRMIHGRPDADLEQEAALRTLTAFGRHPNIERPEALMWKVVRDAVVDHWRRRGRDPTETVEVLPEHRVAERPDLEAAIDRKRRLARVHQAIPTLGCDIRGPVYLFYVEGYTIPTIARVYDKTPSAIKMALCRGRRQLVRALGASGATRSSIPIAADNAPGAPVQGPQ
jgi:RNA polymerase sigma factor (sigma-70 family)